jgi:O-antigen/teichoic acid export membrane protein
MSLSVLFVPLRSLYTAYWTGVGRLGSVLWTGAGGAVVDVLLAFLLVPRLGLAGAVIANVAAQLTACALITRHTRRQSGDLGVPLPYVARVAAIALTVGGASWAATAATAAGAGGLGAPIALLAGAVTCAAAAGLIGAAVGLVPRDDADWVAGALPAGLRPALVLVGGVRWSQSRSALLAAG